MQFLMFVNVFENVLFISITLPLNYGEKEKGPRLTMFNIIEPRVRVPVQEQCAGSISRFRLLVVNTGSLKNKNTDPKQMKR